MGWLSGWGRRKSHTLNQQVAAAGTNYQALIKVYKGSGTDGTEVVEGITAGKVYCDGNCKDDFGDIRFTDNDEETELDYWIWYKSDGNWALFWIELIDDLGAGNVPIYVYYNNNAASTTSDGLATFIRFDDFEDYDIGDLPDPAKGWVSDQGGGSDYVKVVQDPDDPTNKVMEYHNATAGAPYPYAFITWDVAQAISAHFRFRNDLPNTGNSLWDAREIDAAGKVTVSGQTNTKWMWFNGSQYKDYSPVALWADDTWESYEHRIIAPNYHHMVDEGVDKTGGVRANFTNGPRRWGFGIHLGGIVTKYQVDAVFIRKFVVEVDLHGEWGEEEVETVTISVISQDQDGNVLAGVEYAITGVGTFTTPDSHELNKDQTYTYTITEPQIIDGTRYIFKEWEDSNTENPRDRVASGDATYTIVMIATYKLTVTSSPVTGIDFTYDGNSQTTEYISDWTEKGTTIALVMPENQVIGSIRYRWDKWENDSENSARNITLNSDTTVIGYFVAQYKLTIQSNPIDGIQFTMDGSPQITPLTSDWMDENTVIVLIMPMEAIVGGLKYNWDRWGNDSTDRTRNITLSDNVTVIGYFVLAPALGVNQPSEPIIIPMRAEVMYIKGNLAVSMPRTTIVEIKRPLILADREIRNLATIESAIRFPDTQELLLLQYRLKIPAEMCEVCTVKVPVVLPAETRFVVSIQNPINRTIPKSIEFIKNIKRILENL